MASDFSHLSTQDVQGAPIVPFELFHLDTCPILYVKPASESNKPFFNATLRRARSNVGRRPSPAMVAKIRNEDRVLYATHIVDRWERVEDKEGNQVECTPEEKLAFLRALPDWIFDDLRTFCSNLQNFLPEGVAEAEDLGKD